MKERMLRYDEPEMLRLNLSSAILRVKMLDLGDGKNELKSIMADCLTPPPPEAIDIALEDLHYAAAIDGPDTTSNVTPLGRVAAGLPCEHTKLFTLLAGLVTDQIIDALLLVALQGVEGTIFTAPSAFMPVAPHTLHWKYRSAVSQLVFAAGSGSSVIASRNAYWLWRAVQRHDGVQVDEEIAALPRIDDQNLRRWLHVRSLHPHKLQTVHTMLERLCKGLQQEYSDRFPAELIDSISRIGQFPPLKKLSSSHSLAPLICAASAGLASHTTEGTQDDGTWKRAVAVLEELEGKVLGWKRCPVQPDDGFIHIPLPSAACDNWGSLCQWISPVFMATVACVVVLTGPVSSARRARIPHVIRNPKLGAAPQDEAVVSWLNALPSSAIFPSTTTDPDRKTDVVFVPRYLSPAQLVSTLQDAIERELPKAQQFGVFDHPAYLPWTKSTEAAELSPTSRSSDTQLEDACISGYMAPLIGLAHAGSDRGSLVLRKPLTAAEAEAAKAAARLAGGRRPREPLHRVALSSSLVSSGWSFQSTSVQLPSEAITSEGVPMPLATLLAQCKPDTVFAVAACGMKEQQDKVRADLAGLVPLPAEPTDALVTQLVFGRRQAWQPTAFVFLERSVSGSSGMFMGPWRALNVDMKATNVAIKGALTVDVVAACNQLRAAWNRRNSTLSHMQPLATPCPA